MAPYFNIILRPLKLREQGLILIRMIQYHSRMITLWLRFMASIDIFKYYNNISFYFELLYILPWILLANLMSQGNIVPHFIWIVQRLVSSNNLMIYVSVASCSANTAPTCMKWSPWSCCIISFTSLKKGIFDIKSSVDFWNFLISCSAMVPGLNLLWWSLFDIILDFIQSNLLIPFPGVFLFSAFLPLLFVDVTEWASGTPIMAFHLTVTFICAIFCGRKYLK